MTDYEERDLEGLEVSMVLILCCVGLFSKLCLKFLLNVIFLNVQPPLYIYIA